MCWSGSLFLCLSPRGSSRPIPQGWLEVPHQPHSIAWCCGKGGSGDPQGRQELPHVLPPVSPITTERFNHTILHAGCVSVCLREAGRLGSGAQHGPACADELSACVFILLHKYAH